MAILDDILAGAYQTGAPAPSAPQAAPSSLDSIVNDAYGQGASSAPQEAAVAQDMPKPVQPGPTEQPSFGARLFHTVTTPSEAIPAALRFGSGAIAGEGGPVGAAVTGAGEAAAQFTERKFGTRAEYSPTEIAAAGLAGAVPLGRLAQGAGVVGRTVAGAAEGGLIGAIGTTGHALGERGELPTGEEVATGAGIGAAVGGGISGVARALDRTGVNVQRAAQPEAGAWDALAREFHPQGRTDQAAEFENVVKGPAHARENLRDVQIAAHLEDAERTLSRLDEPTAMQFIVEHDAKGTGPQVQNPLLADPELRRASDEMTNVAERVGRQLQRAVPGTGFIPNYIYPLFRDPQRANQVLGQTAMAQGFLNPRQLTMPNIIQIAQQNGLELVSTNPATLLRLRLGQESRFLAASDIARAAERRYGFSPQPTPGHVELEPILARGLFPQFNGAPVYGPEPLVRIMQHDLGPGLDRDSPLRWASDIGGFVMSAKIALSAFHPIFTGLMAAGRHLATGLESTLGAQNLREAFAGLGEAVAGATTVPAVIGDLRRGYQLMRMAEDSAVGSIPNDLQALMRAGGHIVSDHQIANGIEASFRRLREGELSDLPGGILNAVANAVSAPVMRHWVPYLKLGSLASALDHEIRFATRRNPNITPQEIQAISRGVSDVHDNFFGHMVPENLGFSRWMQDFVRSAVQFPGWNIGTLRTFGALGRSFKRGALGQELDPVADATSRYALGILVTTGLFGAAIHAMHNDGQLPQTFMDAFYPKTKSGERISLPTHVRTGVTFARDPIGDVAGKINPVAQIAWDLAENIDKYSGEQIRTPGAPVGQQAAEVASYLGEQVSPIPLSAHRRIAESGAPTDISNAELFAGFGRAPASLSRTDAENLAAQLNAAKLPRGGRSQEDSDRAALKRAAITALRDKAPDASQRVQEAIAKGAVQPRAVRDLLHKAALTPLQASFENLESGEIQRVWAVATPAERRSLMPLYVKKLRSHPEMATQLFGGNQ